MQLIVDRIEGQIAVCETEDDTIIDLPLCSIKEQVHEGDVLDFENGKAVINHEITASRRQHINKLFNKLLKK